MTFIKKHLFFFAWVILFSFVLLLYRQQVSLYFSQDDFFHLRVSQTDGSFGEFVKLGTFRSFEERGGIYFYRPIFREFLFNIYYRLFGLNALPFRLTQFLIHFVNTFLVFQFIYRLTKNKSMSFASACFFALVAANIGIISYLAGGIQVIGALMFYLLASLSFFNYLERNNNVYKYLSIIFYILALSSHELAITLPAIFVSLILLKKGFSKKIFFQYAGYLSVLFLIALAYLFLEISVIGFPTGEKQYALNFSPVKIINSYFWYFLWSFGVPEMLVDFVGPGIKLNPNLMRYWGDYFRIIFPALALIIVLLIFSFKKLIGNKLFWFFIVWFIVGVSPVIFQPSHRLYYYLGIALVGMSGIFGLVFEFLNKKKSLLIVFIATSIVLNLVSVSLANTNYWALTRAKIAESLIKDVTEKYPTLPKGASVYFANDPNHPYLNEEWGNSSKQASIILSGSEALRLVYKDKNLKVFYEDIEPPEKEVNAYSLNAIIYK